MRTKVAVIKCPSVHCVLVSTYNKYIISNQEMDIVFSATARVYTEHTQGHFVHRAIIMNVFK